MLSFSLFWKLNDYGGGDNSNDPISYKKKESAGKTSTRRNVCDLTVLPSSACTVSGGDRRWLETQQGLPNALGDQDLQATLRGSHTAACLACSASGGPHVLVGPSESGDPTVTVVAPVRHPFLSLGTHARASYRHMPTAMQPPFVCVLGFSTTSDVGQADSAPRVSCSARRETRGPLPPGGTRTRGPTLSERFALWSWK